MSEDSRMARLRWRCRRGMKELDQLMLRYLDLYYREASESEQAAYERLLEDYQEPELLALLNGQQVSEDPAIAAVIDRIRQSPAKNYS
ncbi:MAG: succinate dehydrogenase assembly factor 2 [Pseudomonadota bacterium]